MYPFMIDLRKGKVKVLFEWFLFTTKSQRFRIGAERRFYWISIFLPNKNDRSILGMIFNAFFINTLAEARNLGDSFLIHFSNLPLDACDSNRSIHSSSSNPEIRYNTPPSCTVSLPRESDPDSGWKMHERLLAWATSSANTAPDFSVHIWNWSISFPSLV